MLAIALSSWICLSLAMVLYEDLRYRAVSWWVFLSLVVGVLAYRLTMLPAHNVLAHALANLAYLAMLFSLSTLYYIVKKRRWVNLFRHMVGIGDLVFLLSVMVLFDPVSFAFFMMLSGLFALVLHLGLRRARAYPLPEKVPLAGFQALFLLLVFPLLPSMGTPFWGFLPIFLPPTP